MSIKDYAKGIINITLTDDEFAKIISGLLLSGEHKLLSDLLIKKAKHELSFEQGGDI